MSALFEDERPRSSSTPSFVLGKMVPTNFCVPRGPRFGGAAGRGPPRHAKIDFFLCPHGPLRKYFRSVFSACTDLYENIFEAFVLPARTITKHFWSVFPPLAKYFVSQVLGASVTYLQFHHQWIVLLRCSLGSVAWNRDAPGSSARQRGVPT